jgi:hypothetical protein
MQGLPQPGAGQRDQSKFIIFENFQKLNTQALRAGLPENQLAWLENLQPIAQNNLAAVPAIALAALANLPSPELTSVMYYAVFGGVDYLVCFTTTGAGFGVNLATGHVVQFAPDGTFSPTPDVAIWQAQRILINDPVAGYCTWDGNALVTQGGVSPNFIITNPGSYATPPAVTVSGGSGSGFAGVGQLTNGLVTGVTVTNPGNGYKAGDTLTATFAAPAGSGALAHAVMTGVPVVGVSIVTPGQWGFPVGGPGPGTYPLIFSSGAAAGNYTVTNIGPANVCTVTGAAITANGSGYQSTPSISVSWSGTASPPTFSAIMGTGGIASLPVTAGGTGYLVPPPIGISGGHGSATAHSTLTGSSVANPLVLDSNPGGYLVGEVPAVVIGAGGTAAATPHVWPFVPAGTTLAVFQGRVWLGGGQLLQWTGTGASYGNVGYDDFLAADASGSLRITDSDLIHAITALRAYNNYLFILGDQSVKQIGNISLNSAGNVTLFSILTLSSDQGTIWPKSCISFNRVFLFANPNGVYGVFGSSVQKLSSDLDGIWRALDFTQVPQAAILDLNAIHNAVYLVRYKDPLQLITRSLMLVFDGTKWWLANQGNNTVAIATASFLSSDLNVLYGSSGADITQLFANRSGTVPFLLKTALTHHGNAVQNKRIIRAGFSAAFITGSSTITFTLDNEFGSVVPNALLIGGPAINIIGGANDINNTPISLMGKYLGMTLSGTITGYAQLNALIEYQEEKIWGLNAALAQQSDAMPMGVP